MNPAGAFLLRAFPHLRRNTTPGTPSAGEMPRPR